MSTNFTNTTAAPDGSPATPGTIAAVVAALLLALRKHLKRTGQQDLLSRADFRAEMRDISDRIHTDHLSLLEKLDSNHRELLAALGRQGNRISALEAGFARLDERTREQAIALRVDG